MDVKWRHPGKDENLAHPSPRVPITGWREREKEKLNAWKPKGDEDEPRERDRGNRDIRRDEGPPPPRGERRFDDR